MSARRRQTVHDLIRWAEARFTGARLCFGHGTDNALDEAAWLVGSCLGIEPHELDAQLERQVRAVDRQRIETLVAERIATRKPLAYLLREAWFAGLRFYVDERVLVPRSLTGEFIVERFAPWIDAERVTTVLDLCAGSGCIAIALAHAFPGARVDASDLSADALAVAHINVERYGLRERIRLVQSDLFDALGGARYDLIVSNPPYVDPAEMTSLPAEYTHEPRLALTAPDRGLAVILRILAQASAHLVPHGVLVVETGNSQSALQRCFPAVPFVWLTSVSGDESVLLLTAAELGRWCDRFHAAL